MKEEDAMYVKLENNEGVLAKRYFLSTQMNLLRILKAITRYHQIRLKELKSKTKLSGILKEVNQNIKKIETNIPKLTTHHPRNEGIEPRNSQIVRKKFVGETAKDRDLEMQLKDIQEKLRALQG